VGIEKSITSDESSVDERPKYEALLSLGRVGLMVSASDSESGDPGSSLGEAHETDAYHPLTRFSLKLCPERWPGVLDKLLLGTVLSYCAQCSPRFGEALLTNHETSGLSPSFLAHIQFSLSKLPPHSPPSQSGWSDGSTGRSLPLS
jgi:hypothetical protein